MPKRKFSGKRAMYGKRKSMRLVNRKANSLVRRRPKVRISGSHSFTRYAAEPATKQCTGVAQGWAEEFTFDKIAGYTEFTALFDQYVINSVTICIQLISNPDSSMQTNSNATYNSANWYPKLWSIRDYDGGGSDTLAAMRERQGVKYCVLRPNMVKTFVVKPKVLVQTYRTAATTGYAPRTLSIDLANTDVPHYGMHFMIDTLNVDPADTQPFNVRIDYKYNFTLKGVR